jgi:hypothetical protein
MLGAVGPEPTAGVVAERSAAVLRPLLWAAEMAPIRSALRILAEVMPSELAKLCSSGNSIPDRPPLRRRVPDAVAADGAVCSWVSVTVVSDPSEVARAQARGAGVESRR